MTGGCILIARKMLDSDLMDESPLVVKLWVWLLLKAFWKDCDQLKRGQLITTISEMQEATSFYSGWRKITPTKDEIRSAYGALTKATRITTRRTTRGMVITVVNYDAYQNTLAYASHTEPHKGNATGPTATPHDRESLNHKNKYSSSFLSFYDAYPKKKAGGNAFKAWNKINPDDDLLQQILKSLEWQKLQPDWQKDNGQFIPLPASWLNGRRWEDEKPTMVEPATSAAPPTPDFMNDPAYQEAVYAS
jgi:hypothetical protein